MMIKKILVTLLVFIFIFVIGIASLILFVDPNNFRGFIADTVKDKTGYKLTIDGDLRWHIWPQISILTDAISLSDEGAKKPILAADNMRLDVELLPLFSKQLAIKNVLVKSAVINITPESEGQVAKDKQAKSLNNDKTSSSNHKSKSSGWTFSLNKFEVNNSTLVLQQGSSVINFRNLDMLIKQNADKNIRLNVTGNLNHNQQDLNYDVQANIDLLSYPSKATIDLKKFNYTLVGNNLPKDGLTGNIYAVFDYQQSPLVIKSDNLNFSINNNDFKGSLVANLQDKPDIDVILQADDVNLASFIADSKENNTNVTIQQKTIQSNQQNKTSKNLDVLNAFNGKLKLTLNKVTDNSLVFTHLVLDAINQDGHLNINQFDFNFAEGKVLAHASANAKNASVNFSGQLEKIKLSRLFEQLNMDNQIDGLLNGNAKLNTANFDSQPFLAGLNGDLSLVIDNARLTNINLINIIKNAVSQLAKDVVTPEEQENYTQFQELSAAGTFGNGIFTFSNLTADSQTLTANGQGQINLVSNNIDLNLAIKMLSGWNGKNKTVAKLQQMTIPLRIFGEPSNLHYQLEADKILKDLLNDKLQQNLGKLRDKFQLSDNKDNDENKEDNKSKTKQKGLDLLNGIMNKVVQ